MKKAPTRRIREPSRASRRELPEVDFERGRVRRNRCAKRVARDGIHVIHRGPSPASLHAMPEVDLGRARARANRYARRIAAHGLTLQVGRGRPSRAAEVGPTVPRSVRLPPA
jgi:hypothetical protein